MTRDTTTDDETEIETENPTESGIYVWDHTNERPAASGFESLEQAETWATENGPEYETDGRPLLEPVDARPLTEPADADRDAQEMRRSGQSTVPTSRSDVVDYVADYANDAVDAGLEAGEVAAALREAAAEIEDRAMEDVTAEEIIADLEDAEGGDR